MSSLLKEAFIESQKLREAARQQAETDLVGKYASEIRSNMNQILEGKIAESILDEQPEPEPDLGFAGPDDDFEMGEEPEMFGFEDDLEYPEAGNNSYLDNQVPMSFGDGEDLCPCPEDEEEIEIDFDDLMGMSTDGDTMDTSKGGPGGMTGPQSHEDAAQELAGAENSEESFLQEFELDESLFEEYLDEGVPFADETPEERSARLVAKADQAHARKGEFTPVEKDDAYFDRKGKRNAEFEKFGNQWDKINQRQKQTSGTAVAGPDYGREDTEVTKNEKPFQEELEIELDEELAEIVGRGYSDKDVSDAEVSEGLTADVEEQPSGWSPRSDADFDDEFDKLLARLNNPGKSDDDDAEDKVKKAHSAPGDRRTQNDTHDYVNESKKIAQLKRISKKYIKENRNLENKANSYKKKLLEVADLMQQLNIENVKLQLQQKVFGNNSLNERQKHKIVEAISDATTVGEAQRLFKLQESAAGSLSDMKRRDHNPLTEALKNKPTASSVLQNSRRPRAEEEKAIVSENTSGRWKKLAGILND